MSISLEVLRFFQMKAGKVASAQVASGSTSSQWQDARDRELIRLAFVGAMHNEYIRGVNDERRRILRCLGLDIANPIANTGD